MSINHRLPLTEIRNWPAYAIEQRIAAALKGAEWAEANGRKRDAKRALDEAHHFMKVLK